jgi:uncharacterized protein (DUF427 family)
MPAPGQESVWDYPRPPRAERTGRHIEVRFNGVLVADTRAAIRVLETSHPPTYYLPLADVRADLLVASPASSFCEFKGRASYRTLVLPSGRRIEDVAWTYPNPSPGFEAIAGHLAFYASKVDEAWVGDERARPQAGGFYGGWVTSRIVGPFKGEPGTMGW